MPMRLYRCTNPLCLDEHGRGHDFMAAEPVCPKCKTDARLPQFHSVIHTRVVIHYDPPSSVPGIGLRHRACDPTKDIKLGMGSSYPLAVTCPACQATEVFKQMAALGAKDETHDLPDIAPCC